MILSVKQAGREWARVGTERAAFVVSEKGEAAETLGENFSVCNK